MSLYEDLTKALAKATLLSTKLGKDHESQLEKVRDKFETYVEDNDEDNAVVSIAEAGVTAAEEVYVLAKEDPANALAYAQEFLRGITTITVDPRSFTPPQYTVSQFTKMLELDQYRARRIMSAELRAWAVRADSKTPSHQTIRKIVKRIEEEA